MDTIIRGVIDGATSDHTFLPRSGGAMFSKIVNGHGWVSALVRFQDLRRVEP